MTRSTNIDAGATRVISTRIGRGDCSTDRVPELFSRRPLLGVGRDIALAGLDLLPAAKREFVRHAAGVAVKAPG
ncbi:MAG: hypothetical protein R3E54_18020 [Halioglobus sp.]